MRRVSAHIPVQIDVTLSPILPTPEAPQPVSVQAQVEDEMNLILENMDESLDLGGGGRAEKQHKARTFMARFNFRSA